MPAHRQITRPPTNLAVLCSGVRANRVAAIAVIAGMHKPWRTTFSERDYKSVRELGDEHRRHYPRKIAMCQLGQVAGAHSARAGSSLQRVTVRRAGNARYPPNCE